jgi:DNA (cytosine-5)-methyltransferase 1
MKKIVHGSLFSGVGGFDLAAEMVGWQNAFHCEWNPFGQKVLKHYWPKTQSISDIRKFKAEEYHGRIDIISGGFPCQPFSNAGKRKGAEDDRYLWPEKLRVVNAIRPTWVCGENVAGLTTMVHPPLHIEVESQADIFNENIEEIITEECEYIMYTIGNDFERIGYEVQPFLIPACGVEACHQRDRVWFIAYNTDHRCEAGFGPVRGSQGGAFSSPIGAGFRAEDIGFDKDDSNGNMLGHLHGEPEKHPTETGQHAFDEFGERIGNGPNSNIEGLEGQNGMRVQDGQGGRIGLSNVFTPWGSGESWVEAATRLCGMDDGIPNRLDTKAISRRKWYEESIKAYGNAIVPQVAYEIFKVINETYK